MKVALLFALLNLLAAAEDLSDSLGDDEVDAFFSDDDFDAPAADLEEEQTGGCPSSCYTNIKIDGSGSKGGKPCVPSCVKSYADDCAAKCRGAAGFVPLQVESCEAKTFCDNKLTYVATRPGADLGGLKSCVDGASAQCCDSCRNIFAPFGSGANKSCVPKCLSDINARCVSQCAGSFSVGVRPCEKDQFCKNTIVAVGLFSDDVAKCLKDSQKECWGDCPSECLSNLGVAGPAGGGGKACAPACLVNYADGCAKKCPSLVPSPVKTCAGTCDYCQNVGAWNAFTPGGASALGACFASAQENCVKCAAKTTPTPAPAPTRPPQSNPATTPTPSSHVTPGETPPIGRLPATATYPSATPDGISRS